MGKQGPCYHCGTTTTPLWRNGPPDKPVLCNACGSRWRTKGSLTNYTPIHARGDPSELRDHRIARVKNIPIIKNKEPKVKIRTLNPISRLVKGVGPDCNLGLQKVKDEENSNHSSSGSAMSNSDGCVQFDNGDTSEFTDRSQSIVWDSTVPSKKRTCVNRPTTSSSSLDHLTKDLYAIFHEQQSSQYSTSCEDDLLFESNTPMVSVEIGHGSVLIRHPSYVAKEEESVASSFPVDNRPNKANEAYSHPNSFSNNQGANVLSLCIEKNKKSIGLGMQNEQHKREKTQHESLQILGNPYSTLCCIYLKEVLNFDEFEGHLTNEEQQNLLKFLPSIDTAKRPDSLKGMFGSDQFKENISSFQKLLAEGVFDLSLSGVRAEDCKMLRKLVLGNPIKSKWVEQYNLLKEMKCKNYNEGSAAQEEPKSVESAYSTNLKRHRDDQFQKLPGAKPTMKSPKRTMKSIYEHSGQIDNDTSCFSPKSLFMSPPTNNNFDSFTYMYDSSDQDLLLEVPSNGSFPEAELLLPNFVGQASTSSSYI